MTDEVTTTETAAPAEAAPVQTLEDVLTSHMEATYSKIEARDAMPDKGADGRFVSNTPKVAPTAAAPAAVSDQPTPKEGETVKPSIPAPNSWSDADKAWFAELPPERQAYIAKREGEAHQQITRQGEELKRFDPIIRALEPHRARMQHVGVAEPEFISRLLNAEAALQNPQSRGQAFKWLADQYGFDLATLTGQTPAGGQAAQPTDPALAAINSKIAGLERWANGLAEAEQRQARERNVASERDAQAKADAYLNDPKYPHAKDLEGDIASLILASRQLGQTLTFEDAYKRATRANEGIWSKMEAERIAADKKKGEEAAAQAAAAAKKRAPTIVKPRGSAAKPAPAKGDWEARMRDTYDRIEGAA